MISSYTIEKSASPGPALAAALRNLENLCLENVPGCPGWPEEDYTEYFLCAFDKDSALLAALSVGFAEEKVRECVGMTRPDQRRQGLMRALVKAARRDIGEDGILIPCAAGDTDSASAVKALGGAFCSEEHLMRLDLPAEPSLLSGDFPALSLSRKRRGGTLRYTFRQGRKTVASCTVLPGEKTASFGEFAVREELRGQGIGTAALALTLRDLKARGASRVLLHVTGSNVPALALYRRAGFRDIAVLSYYLLPSGGDRERR